MGGELSRFPGRFKIISVCYILLGIKVLDCFPPPCTGKSGVVNWIIEDIVFSPKLEDPKLSERLSTTAVDICFNMLLLRKLVILRIIQYKQIIIQYQEAQLWSKLDALPNSDPAIASPCSNMLQPPLRTDCCRWNRNFLSSAGNNGSVSSARVATRGCNILGPWRIHGGFFQCGKNGISRRFD